MNGSAHADPKAAACGTQNEIVVNERREYGGQ
jgi:hypothetical protein